MFAVVIEVLNSASNLRMRSLALALISAEGLLYRITGGATPFLSATVNSWHGKSRNLKTDGLHESKVRKDKKLYGQRYVRARGGDGANSDYELILGLLKLLGTTIFK